MKALKITLLILVGVFALLLLISFFLPTEVLVTRNATLQSSPSHAFKRVNNIPSWVHWNVWFQNDTSIVWTEIKEEKNTGYHWFSNNPNIGEGTIGITEIFPDTLLKTAITFGDWGISGFNIQIRPEPEGINLSLSLVGNQNKLPWFLRPFAAYFFLLMDRMAGPDLEVSLKNLQSILESDPALYVGEFEAEYRDFPGMNYIGIREKVADSLVGHWLNNSFRALYQQIKNGNGILSGVPFTIHHGVAKGFVDIEAALATPDLFISQPPARSLDLKPGKWLVIKYYGSFENLAPIYQQGFEFLNQYEKRVTGPPMEFYFSDPLQEPDSSRWYTEVVIPCTP